MRNVERHRTGHSGWLRAAVLGANDGMLSTASRFPSFRTRNRRKERLR